MKNETVYNMLSQFNLLDYKEEILKNSKPCIRLFPSKRKDEDIPVGGSKLGGDPDLPAELDIPEYQNNIFSFLAQINCQDINAYNIENLLPTKGFIYFFYDCESFVSGIEITDKNHWKVMYYDGIEENLKRNSISQYLSEENYFKSALVEGKLGVSFADLDSYELEDVEWKDYGESYIEFLECFERKAKSTHQLLGQPKVVQMDVFEEVLPLIQECKNNKNISREDLILLFQLDTDEVNTNMLWGDEGIIHFFITKEDLQERNFQDVWLSLQSK
ncbi:YwqG family protein [Priestia megaterium]|uniref:YwqG family protein n=1 Tax=Priestia megaterium TaxID=1404 RepID=UPI00221EFB50|nr:YwqG family protein [Priestia megaterium]UYV55659.1 YwqG family protein [Priestia megaterium]